MEESPLRAADSYDPGLARAREEMLRLVRRYVRDPRVIEAMAAVPRERFVPDEQRARAYDDAALSIGERQTISQPLIVALMLDALQLRAGDRVLEVGTGSGYQAALLSQLAAHVVTVERLPLLAQRARSALAAAGADNVRVVDAAVLGFPAEAPYDAIVVAAAAPHVPRSLVAQLAEGGGRMVLPIGARSSQELVRVSKTPHGVALARLGPCVFVPLIGDEGWPDRSGIADDQRILR